MKDWSNYKRAASLKKFIIKERGHKCEKCNLEVWSNAPIPLEIHHKDNDRTNNTCENLELNCPNCHFLTKGFRNRLPEPRTREQKKRYENKNCFNKCICGENKRKKSNVCRKCSDKFRRERVTVNKVIYIPKTKIDCPTKERLHWLIWNYPLVVLGKTLGVTGNAVSKHCKKNKLKPPGFGFWRNYELNKIIDYQI